MNKKFVTYDSKHFIKFGTRKINIMLIYNKLTMYAEHTTNIQNIALHNGKYMNSRHAVSASKNNNTECTAHPVKYPKRKSPRDGRAWRLIIALYAVCYFWTHLLHTDCSFNYFFALSSSRVETLFKNHNLHYACIKRYK